jgi:hypothetical protein
VYFHRQANGSPIAVATDGRKLIAATWQEGAPPFATATFQANIPAAVCERVLSFSAPQSRYVLIDKKDESVNRVSIKQGASANIETLDVATLEGRFPQYRDLFLDASGTTTTKLIVNGLEEVMANFREMGVTEVTMAVHDDHRIIFTGENEDGVSVAAVLMDCRVDEDTVPQLGWTPSRAKVTAD